MMDINRRHVFFLVCAAASALPLRADFHADVSARIPAMRAAIPDISAAASAAADRVWLHRKAQIRFAENEGYGIREELIARAGGLAQIGALGGKTPDDIILLAVRDWERQSAGIEKVVRESRDEGLLVVMFASREGMPADVKPDFLIDNGASGGAKELGPANAMANIVHAWMWCCEYAAAFSRRGIFPAIIKSIAPEDSWVLNSANDTPDSATRFYPCGEAIPAGELAAAYLNRFRKLLADAEGSDVSEKIGEAADLIVDRLSAGRRVGVSGLGHFILEEVKHDLKSPMLGFRSVWMLPNAYSEVLDKGDVLVWLTYAGMNSTWDDYGKCIREAEVELVSSFGTGYPPASTAGHAVHIPQSWSVPDAEVAIPVPPYAMAPVSCVNRVLLLRMLDDAVAERIAARGLSIPKTKPLPYLYFEGEGGEPYPAAAVFAGRTEGDVFGKVDFSGNEKPAAEPESAAKEPAKSGGDFGRISDCDGNSCWDRGATGLGDGSRFIEKDGKWGVIAADGSVRMKPRYDILRLFSAETRLLTFMEGRKAGLCKADGSVAVPAKYDAIRSRDGCRMYARDLRWGFLGADGRELSPAMFRGLVSRFGDFGGRGLFVASKEYGDDARSGLFRDDGEEVVAPKYAQIIPFRDDLFFGVGGDRVEIASITNGPVPVKGRWGRIRPCTIAGREFFRVQNGRKAGLLGGDGSTVVPVECEPLSVDMATGVALGRVGGRWMLFGMDGASKPFPVDCDFAAFMSARGRSSSDSAGSPFVFRVAKDGKWGVADESGRMVVPMEYSRILPLDAERAYVAKGGEWRLDVSARPRFTGAKWGVVDSAGRVCVPVRYTGLRPAKDGDGLEFIITDRIPRLVP